MKATLIADAYSNTKAKIYAVKGDKVTIVKDCGLALIVEDLKGKRFPISKHKVKLNESNNTTEAAN
ncbi:hypothetical protein UFOVP153_27 [uncultured Caudovirales phage]|uniref:Uncharacterized protein n=1 Tax=uncultured Caudovirales phage TaxID=2100421 RepID=A0A6J5KW15_9CAUD|nr:hypothetical protein UFOVP69_31 [uncultured Caudovirales phage]CAB5170552.1 hypothetical protein UFOVP153_27 [uncultured Caudovirales phage]